MIRRRVPKPKLLNSKPFKKSAQLPCGIRANSPKRFCPPPPVEPWLECRPAETTARQDFISWTISAPLKQTLSFMPGLYHAPPIAPMLGKNLGASGRLRGCFDHRQDSRFDGIGQRRPGARSNGPNRDRPGRLRSQSLAMVRRKNQGLQVQTTVQTFSRLLRNPLAHNRLRRCPRSLVMRRSGVRVSPAAPSANSFKPPQTPSKLGVCGGFCFPLPRHRNRRACLPPQTSSRRRRGSSAGSLNIHRALPRSGDWRGVAWSSSWGLLDRENPAPVGGWASVGGLLQEVLDRFPKADPQGFSLFGPGHDLQEFSFLGSGEFGDGNTRAVVSSL